MKSSLRRIVSIGEVSGAMKIRLTEIPFIESHLDEKYKKQIHESRKRFCKQQTYIWIAIFGVAIVSSIIYWLLFPQKYSNADAGWAFYACLILFIMIFGIAFGIGGQNICMRNSAFSIFNKWCRENMYVFEVAESVTKPGRDDDESSRQIKKQKKILHDLTKKLDNAVK